MNKVESMGFGIFIKFLKISFEVRSYCVDLDILKLSM